LDCGFASRTLFLSLGVFLICLYSAAPELFISAEPDKSAVGECTLMVDIGSGSSCAPMLLFSRGRNWMTQDAIAELIVVE